MADHSVLYLFGDDLFHQILFYFGGVVAMLIFLYEKRNNKKIQWRWIGAFFLFCVFVSCFQAWVDEHHNSQVLITEKAALTSDKSNLQSKLDAKQSEVDWLRDHREIAVGQPDPRISAVLDRLSKESQELKTRPGMETKKGLIGLAQEMVELFMKEKAPMDKAEQEELGSPLSDWQAKQNKIMSVSRQMDANLQRAMITNYGPRAVALLEQLPGRGESITGIKDKDIQEAIGHCSVTNVPYWGMQVCIQDISTIAQRMH